MATSVAKKRTEEQRAQAMKELTALPCNKKCLECHQLGPVYADITIASFVCTTCSGYLRGLNPPHRVKSISMTTFTDSEVDTLTKGGNDVANQVWLGRWDPKQDREPDKKNPVVFKEYLVAKYERKQWYAEPGEHREEPKVVAMPPIQSKLPGPPKVEKTRTAVSTVSSQASSPVVAAAAAVAVASSDGGLAPKVDLLGGLENDPFGAIQLLSSNMPALTTSVVPSLVPNSKASDAPTKGAGAGANPLPGGSTPAALATSSLEDRYAALASLDMTLKEIKTKEEEEQHQRELQLQQEQQQRELLVQQQQLQQLQQQQLLQQQQFQQQQLQQQQQFQQQQFQGQFGAPNPFGTVTGGSSGGPQQYSNPFGGAAQQASFGMPHQGSQQFVAFGQSSPGAGGQQQWGQQSLTAQQQWNQQGMGGVAQAPGQQGFSTQQQGFSGQQGFHAQQGFGAAQGFMGQQQVAVGGASRVPPTQQMGLGPQQQQPVQGGVAWGFVGQQPGVASGVQTQQLGGGTAGFGGPQQGSFGGPQQGTVGAAGFAGPLQTQQSSQQFGSFVASGAAGMPQQADKAANLSGRGAQNVSAPSSDASLGWSTTMNKPVPLPQSAPPLQATPTGWSSGISASVQMGGGWGTSALFGGSPVSQGAGQAGSGSFGVGQAGTGSLGTGQAGSGSFGTGQAGSGSFGSAQTSTGLFGASGGSFGSAQTSAGPFGASGGSWGSFGLQPQQMSSPAAQPSQQQVANPFAPQKADSGANPFF